MYGHERNLDDGAANPNLIFVIDTIQYQCDTISNYKERSLLLGT